MLAAALCAGCVIPAVQSSALATGPAGSPSSPDTSQARPQAPKPGPGKPQPGAPPPRVAVRVSVEPVGAREVGLVEAHGRQPRATLALLVAELQRRAAELGGDLVKVDSFRTRYELVNEDYTYDCGTDETVMETESNLVTDADGQTSWKTEIVPRTRHVDKTCTGTRQVEVGTLTLVGRAFRAVPVNSQETP